MSSWKAAVAGFLAGGAVTATVFVVMRQRERKDDRDKARTQGFLRDEADRSDLSEYIPPLPDSVKALLMEARLADLSCNDGDAPPHTSLMNFSFIGDEQDIIVITTRRDTRKFELMQQSPCVSLLLHDFPITATQRKHQGTLNFQRTLSVSIQGKACLQTGAQAERYRKLHLARNAEYANFISGEDKAVITIKILKARMCNDDDRVTCWQGPSLIAPPKIPARKVSGDVPRPQPIVVPIARKLSGDAALSAARKMSIEEMAAASKSPLNRRKGAYAPQEKTKSTDKL
mmetsp:Transcript_5980/g.11553  ORF Transcript_5980/g.11553 Transcript_5980/m.11553 type:complete len:287 (-) Transcript_5980:137-997(-)|eukprot:CAMPEP_0173392830 /NCGR_PEP_ID=MMETSP1356-20130122/21384_1 /TAXON_ID=77927 ORGANISM="Hemiselmis virescens, Strain PCC157" /NCGR_SAMPLE_ID=MMETSP1356 /ASSEMBLY_ACC=CAM_ASM_000847 /LENGTH=286 /DNA_ID=CAMNT_0014350739 /DNA_START=58 /DNA_END=918 /DNA_ORIENTATION=-